LFIIVFAPLTLAWKLMPTGVGADELKNSVVTLLLSHDYKIIQQTIVAEGPVIRAERDGCEIVLAEMSPEGWSRDLFEKTTSSMDRKFFIFDGRMYTDQPTWMTVTSDRWSAYLRRLGIGRPPPFVLAVAETSSCNAEQLPWSDLIVRTERKTTLQ
jgi:hypothetical protein